MGAGWVLGNQVGLTLCAKFWVQELHPGEAISASVSAIIDSMVKTILEYYGRLLKINQIMSIRGGSSVFPERFHRNYVMEINAAYICLRPYLGWGRRSLGAWRGPHCNYCPP